MPEQSPEQFDEWEEKKDRIHELLCELNWMELLEIARDIEKMMDYEAKRMEMMKRPDPFAAYMKAQMEAEKRHES